MRVPQVHTRHRARQRQVSRCHIVMMFGIRLDEVGLILGTALHGRHSQNTLEMTSAVYQRQTLRHRVTQQFLPLRPDQRALGLKVRVRDEAVLTSQRAHMHHLTIGSVGIGQ